MLTPLITFGQVLDAPGGRAVLERHLPGVADAPATADLRPLLVGAFLRVTPGLRDDPAARERFWAEVDEVMAPVLFHPHAEAVAGGRPRSHGRAPFDGLRHRSGPGAWSARRPAGGCWRSRCRGRPSGNPFVDVELSAEFRCGDRTWTVGGFYDGEGVYRLRALAEEEGRWEFVTTSTAPVLDGIRGEVTVGPAAPDAHGPVRVDGFHFAYADGTRYRPWGTTAYAWNHQDESLQQATLDTLAATPFTKLRMCLFPKHFVFNTDEPERFPFPRAARWVLRPHPVRPRLLRPARRAAAAPRGARRTG